MRFVSLLGVTFFEALAARRRSGPTRPSWNLQFEWIVRFLRRDFLEAAGWPYPELRKELDSRPGPKTAQRRVAIRDDRVGGVPVVWFTPPELRSDAVLVFFHGGSYIIGSARTTHAELLADLALRLKLRVLGPEYRLAPENPYPAALEDAFAVYRGLVESGVAPSAIVLSGDSAGGNLALVLQLKLRDEQREQCRAAALISPWLDLTGSRPSCTKHEASDYGHTSFLSRQAREFAQGVPLEDPRISPINAALAGLNPLLVQVGDAERLYDEGVELVQRARAAGVQAELDVAADMPHNPALLADFHPHAKASLERLAAYIGTQLEG